MGAILPTTPGGTGPCQARLELFEAITRSSFGATGLSRDLAERRLAFALSRYDEGWRTVALLERASTRT